MKRQFHLLAVIFLLAATPFSGVFSNNLSISNVSYVLGTTKTVTFNLSWNNGWRNTTVAPHNWDAAWVFIKWRDCGSYNDSLSFTHGLISTAFTDHNFSS